MSSIGGDQTITNHVQLKLSNRGIRFPCNVSVQTKKGEVTLSGTVQFAHQKAAAVQAATGVTGVKRVTDSMSIGVKRVT